MAQDRDYGIMGGNKQGGSYASCTCGKWLYHSRFKEDTAHCPCGRAFSKADIAIGASLRRRKGGFSGTGSHLAPRRVLASSAEAVDADRFREPEEVLDAAEMVRKGLEALRAQKRLAEDFVLPEIAPPQQKPEEPPTVPERHAKAQKAFNLARHESEKLMAAHAKGSKRLENARKELAEAQEKHALIEKEQAEAHRVFKESSDELSLAGAALTAFNAEQAREASARVKGQEPSERHGGLGSEEDMRAESPSKRARSDKSRSSQSTDESALWQQFQDFCAAEVAAGRGPGDGLLLKSQELFQGIRDLAAKEGKSDGGDCMDTSVGAGAGITFSGVETLQHAIHTPIGDNARRAAEAFGTLLEPSVPVVPTNLPEKRP